MQIHPLNLDKALLLPRNLVIFLENFEGLQLPQSLIFYAEILHTFPSYHYLKRVVQVFVISLINLVSLSVQKPALFILANNSRSKQNEANLKGPFEHIGKQETCAKFQQNLLNSMVEGARFFRQNIWSLKNNRALSKVLCGILHYLNGDWRG